MSWPSVKLEAVSEFIRNGASIKQSNDAAGLPITRIETIADRTVNLDKCGYADVSEVEYLNYRLRNGDILISHINSEKHLAKCAIFESDRGDIVHGMNLLCLRPSCEVVFSKYLFHYLSSSVFLRLIPAITKKSVNQASFTVTAFKDLEIPLPPLPEQKRIAAILDKADAIRRKRQQAIQLADDFLRAVFLDMFGDPVTNPKGWPVDKFGNVFDVRDGTHDSPSYVSSGFPLITSKNIKNGEIDMLDVNYISKEDYELINRRSKVDVGDILMPMIGTIGNPAIVRDEPLFAIKNVALIKLGRSSLPAEFVLALLNGPLLEAAVQQKSRGGTQKFLGLGDIRDLNCYLPDERLVSKYIGIANKVRQFASAYRKADEAGLEGSLSQKAFSGHL
ncbi:restriction endonuclease subunit S [Stutzerimonas balearica]|uniref:restriction endonuclease subunit S n=1 Tax=Pseudomonadaceae TaxID=135621 RepID=UPI0013F4861A|nr:MULTISPECIES: restriction endonuclease subunit S [Pseudomonadaceae]QII98853.1 restriction endonuclease subunit S [Stutzerimonas balearica]